MVMYKEKRNLKFISLLNSIELTVKIQSLPKYHTHRQRQQVSNVSKYKKAEGAK